MLIHYFTKYYKTSHFKENNICELIYKCTLKTEADYDSVAGTEIRYSARRMRKGGKYKKSTKLDNICVVRAIEICIGRSGF